MMIGCNAFSTSLYVLMFAVKICLGREKVGKMNEKIDKHFVVIGKKCGREINSNELGARMHFLSFNH